MGTTTRALRLSAMLSVATLWPIYASGQGAGTGASQTASAPFSIDLPTALRLAQADNLDVQLARERINEAQANHASAVARFLPWITVGVGYRRHEGRTQAVDGTLLDADKESTSMGPSLTAQVDMGDAWFATLAAKQAINAANASLQAQRQETVLNAATGYFDLLRAKAVVDATNEALNTSAAYEQQLQGGVSAGVIFRGDLLRVQTQTLRYQAALLQARQQQRQASARLAELLRLDPAVELMPLDSELIPIALLHAESTQDAQIQHALDMRAELQQSLAQREAAREARSGTVYGPLIPSVGVQAFVGEFGGGLDGANGNYGGSEDYYVGINWRIGPGGLFDFSRIRASSSRLTTAEINVEKTSNSIRRQVVEARTKARSTAEQLTASRDSLAAATETLRLTRERRQLGVGVVLEDIQAQQELVRTRTEYLNAVTEYNKAQYELSRALGSL